MMARPTPALATSRVDRAVPRGRGDAWNQAPGTLAKAAAVVRRMECRGGDGAPLVVVEDAHPPVVLEKALAGPRPLERRRVITAAPGGGERDQGGRPPRGLKVPRPSHAPRDLPRVHLSDRAQVVEALHERREGHD
jgi:hypothetical protein